MPEPRRLLVVIDGMEIGGSQRQIIHLLANLDRQRWRPELAYFRRHSAFSESVRTSGIPVHHIPKERKVDPRFLMELTGLIRRGDYALVHAFSLTAELWTAIAIMLAGSRTPFIASERSSFREDTPAWYWPLKRFIYSRSAGIVANSHAGATSIGRYTRVPPSHVAVVANGVDVPTPLSPTDHAALRQAVGVPAHSAFGLFVGRLVEVKNIPCMIRALASLPQEGRPFIAVAGDGPLMDDTRKRIAASGLEKDMVLLGERTDATRLMQVADFLVLPSLHEGMSNVVLEAMAAGCPVVASDVGGTPELIEHARTGLLFPSDDSDALAAAMATLVADDALRARIGQASACHAIQHHSQAGLAAAMSSVYERVLRTPTSGHHARRGTVEAPIDARNDAS